MGATTLERLLDHLFGSAHLETALARELRTWLDASAPFRLFVDSNRDKIRKKLRTAGDPEALLDVRAELLAARIFSANRRFAFEYEAYGSGKRGPDLTLVFRANQRLNVEVTRLRSGAAERLPHALLSKLRQFPAAEPNALLLFGVDTDIDEASVTNVVRQLKARSERKEDTYFTSRGYQSARDFNAHLLRLSAILVTARSPTLWQNREARNPLPAELTSALRRCLAAGGSDTESHVPREKISGKPGSPESHQSDPPVQ
jgi:hypothetical protein